MLIYFRNRVLIAFILNVQRFFFQRKELLDNLVLISDQFKKSNQKVGYNMDITRQSASLVLNPITVYTCSYGFLFNCTTVGHASDSMTILA